MDKVSGRVGNSPRQPGTGPGEDVDLRAVLDDLGTREAQKLDRRRIHVDVAANRAWISHLETIQLAGDVETQREIAQARAKYACGEFTTGDTRRAFV